ncbi:hypothetical protein HanRHA438_Chr01g0004061 [Helianthus annuus]|nr:hypothetical protein HanRHA438_Chr01g0004061 [Helianthus annuus]
MKVKYFTLIKYFLTMVLMKNSAAKLDNNRIPPKLVHGTRSQGGIRGCDTYVEAHHQVMDHLDTQ